MASKKPRWAEPPIWRWHEQGKFQPLALPALHLGDTAVHGLATRENNRFAALFAAFAALFAAFAAENGQHRRDIQRVTKRAIARKSSRPSQESWYEAVSHLGRIGCVCAVDAAQVIFFSNGAQDVDQRPSEHRSHGG